MFRFVVKTFYATVGTQEKSNIKTLVSLLVFWGVKYFKVTIRIHYGDVARCLKQVSKINKIPEIGFETFFCLTYTS